MLIGPPPSLMLSRLQDNIDTLRAHIITIQDEETGRCNKFREALEGWDPKARGDKLAEQERLRVEFKESILALREQRRRYRSLLWDALEERNKALVSGEKELKQEKEYRLLVRSLAAFFASWLTSLAAEQEPHA